MRLLFWCISLVATVNAWEYLTGKIGTTFANVTSSNPFPGGRASGNTFSRYNTVSQNYSLIMMTTQGWDTSATLNGMSDVWSFQLKTNSWEFLGGSPVGDNPASFASPLAVEDIRNFPAGREDASTAFDGENAYMYGGNLRHHAGFLGMNDVWRFNTTSRRWALLHNNTYNASAVYGPSGQEDPLFDPGRRSEASTAYSRYDHCLYLFGGIWDQVDGVLYMMNALWRFNLSSLQWAFINGAQTWNSLGNYPPFFDVEDGVYQPRARFCLSCMVSINSSLFLYGGLCEDGSACSDIWRYNIAIGKWSLLYGSAAVFSGASYYQDMFFPPRFSHAITPFRDGFFSFGGHMGSNVTREANDLYFFNVTAMQAFLIGPYAVSNAPPVYPPDPEPSPGSRYDTTLVAIDHRDHVDIYVVCGVSLGLLNDVFRISIASTSLANCDATRTCPNSSAVFSSTANFDSDAPSVTGPIVGVVAGLVVLFLLALFLWWFIRHRAKPTASGAIELRDKWPAQTLVVLPTYDTRYTNYDKIETDRASQFPYQSGAGLTVPEVSRILTEAELEGVTIINPELVSMIAEVGGGNFGIVWRCNYQHAMVAMKVPRVYDETTVANIQHEAYIAKRLRNHDNIVSFIGASFTPGQLMIGMKYYPLGNLEDLLKRLRQSQARLSVEEYLQFLLDSSAAIAVLHDKDVIHRDVAARNFLIKDENRVRGLLICDFGLALVLPFGSTYARAPPKERLPIALMAPEALQFNLFSRATDVFMFGLLMWEMWMCQEPFHSLPPQEAARSILEGQRPVIPPEGPVMSAVLFSMMTRCWSHNPLQRPGMGEIHRELVVLQRVGANKL